MRSLLLLLLVALPAAGAQVVLVDDVTAWDAQLRGDFGGLALAGHDGLQVHVDAEDLVVHVYESTRVRTAMYGHWTSPTTTTHPHHDATLTARSYGGNIVVLDAGATFNATGDQVHVDVPTRTEISDHDVGAREPPRRSTAEDLVVQDAVQIVVQGDFLLAVDQYLVHVDDGEDHVYDARTDHPDAAVEVDPDARHVVVEARNATLRVDVPATGAGGGLYFPRAELVAPRITGVSGDVDEVVVERQGDVIAAQPVSLAADGLQPTGAVGDVAGADVPAWALWAAMAGVICMFVVVRFWAWDVGKWTERADVELRRGRLVWARILAGLAVLRCRGSPDAASLLGQVQDRRGRFRFAYRAHVRAAHLYVNHEDRGHAAFDAAVAAAALGWGRRAGDMLVRAVGAWPDMALRNLADEPAFNIVLDNPAFQKVVGNHFAA